MSWSALVVSALVSAAPAKRFNVEPVILGAGGLVACLIGGGALVQSERTYRALADVRTDDVTTREEAVARVAFAQTLRDRGVSEARLGGSMIGVGAALLLGSVVWFLVEGPQTVSAMVGWQPEGAWAGALVRF